MEDNGAILRARPRGENKESYIYIYIYGWRVVGDKSHSTRSKEEIQKLNKVQTDKNNDHIRSLRRYQIRSLRRYQIGSLRRYPIISLIKD
jgi:hypothetical protein